jgi:hypothetical protein
LERLEDSGSTATLGELAAELGISRERVRQLQREAEGLLAPPRGGVRSPSLSGSGVRA